MFPVLPVRPPMHLTIWPKPWFSGASTRELSNPKLLGFMGDVVTLVLIWVKVAISGLMEARVGLHTLHPQQ